MVDVTTLKTQWWSPKLGEFNGVAENIADIEQCIRIILNTPKGSDPHRPTFASNTHSFIDRPLNLVRGRLIREITKAIETWEPRLILRKVDLEYDKDSNPAQTIAHITWRLKVGAVEQITQIILAT